MMMSNQHDNTYGGERDGTDPEALFDDIDDIEADEEAEDREAAESGEDASGQTRRHPAEIIAALNVENNELKDRALRVTADMENLRRRTEREIGDAKRYAVSKFARDILAVSDNLARALEAVPAEAREAADATLKSLLEGVEMTERELQNALSKNGVVKLEPHGEKFDPNLHQAMFEIPNPEMPDGAVAQVMQSGYKIGDRVLRPAMVGVARGGPKGFPAPAENSGPDDGAAEPGSEVDKSV